MSRRKLRGEMLRIVWTDSVGDGGWTGLDELSTNTAGCVSVGICLNDSSESLTVALSFDMTNRNYDSSITIPRFAIQSIEILDAVACVKGESVFA